MAGSLFPAGSPVSAFPREDCEWDLVWADLDRGQAPGGPGSRGRSGELEGEET